MNPYEMPSCITLTDCLDFWGTDEFEDKFFTELAKREHELPLECLCRDGYPSMQDWAVFEELKIKDSSDGVVIGDFQVNFTEESPTGCKDIQWKSKISGRIDFSLRLKTGEIEFDATLIEREYDGEEF